MRWLFKIAAVAVVLGAVVNVLVAWGCALWVRVQMESYDRGASELVGRFVPPDWLMPPPGFEKGYVDQSMTEYCRGPGIRIEASMMLGGSWSRTGQGQGMALWGTIVAQRCGWPLLCTESACIDPGLSGTPWRVGCITPPKYLAARVYRDGFSPPGTVVSLRPGLPMRAVALPFAFNTLFYAAVIAGLIIAPGAVRRAERRRKGRCIACGYDRRGLTRAAACPECGSVVAHV